MWERIKKIAAEWGSNLTFGDYLIRLGSAGLSLGGGGIMSWAASVTGWLQEWGPIATVAAGVLGSCLVALSLAIIYALVSFGRMKRAQASYHDLLASTAHTVNPLARGFSTMKISLADLQIHHSAVDFPQQDKIFSDCVIVGPGTMAFSNCTLTNIKFPMSNIAKFNGFGLFFPNVFFHRCTFVNCTFLHLTLFIRTQDAENFSMEFPGLKFTEEAQPIELPAEVSR
jgi:hypothetical protein